MSSRRWGARCAFFLATSFACAQAFAQPSVTPPKVSEVPEPKAPAPDHEVVVELELTVAVDGSVTDPKVVSAADPVYDEAALASLRAARFEPAARNGVNVPARIRYTVTFRAAPVVEAPRTEPGTNAAPTASTASLAPTSVPAEPTATFGGRAVVEAPPRETTVRTMGTGELRMLGVRGDPLRAVELLPGMGRTGFGNPLPLIRGSAPQESQVFYEGLPVPLLYHFGGLTSFVPARALARVDFYPGNFSARYGRVLGGVIDVRAKEPRTDSAHGALDVNFLDAQASAEAPLVGAGRGDVGEDADRVRIAASVGFRRSYVDAYFSSIAPDDLGVRTAPAYYDYQGMVVARLSRKHTARVLVLGSRDSFEVVSSRPSDADPLGRGTFGGGLAFHRVQASLKSRFSPVFTQEATVAFGVENYRQNLGAIARQDVDAASLFARAEWIYRPIDALRLAFGIDHASQRFHGDYEGPRPTFETGTFSPSAMPRASYRTPELWVHAPALYAEAGLAVAEGVTVMPSLRVDYFDPSGSVTVDPRLAIRATVAEKTTLKLGVGKFTQLPQLVMILPVLGNPDIRPGHAMHYSAGVEQGLGDSVRLGAEGFVKTLHRIPFDTRDYRAPGFDNAGTGGVVGLELEARVLPKGRVYGLASYTLSRSVRFREGEAVRLFENDQTHVASTAVAVRLGRGWEASATFRLTSANPRTPVVGSVYDARVDQYTPRNGAVYSDRGPLYHRLDLHVEKTWSFQSWKLMAYLDIQNLYNSANREGVAYNYDYTKSQGSRSFPPFFPSLGLRGEL